jgi:hypothetical protein
MAAKQARPEKSDRSEEHSDSDLIRELPKEVAVLLLVAGVGGILLPGPVGTPFLLVGAVTLWPRLFTGIERSFQRRFPKTHRAGVRQVRRFVADLERRYPVPD